MIEKLIPEHIDPFRYAEQSLQLEGVVKLTDMPRLSANLFATDDKVAVHLQFGVDEQGINFIKGRLNAKLILQCQRCMEPYIYEIMPNFALGLVSTVDEANALPELYEPALAKEGSLALRELIEDEIILNLPIIPRHELEGCKVKLSMPDLNGVNGKQVEKSNPFHVLSTLKEKGKDK
jgi:uncharacterized protein